MLTANAIGFTVLIPAVFAWYAVKKYMKLPGKAGALIVAYLKLALAWLIGCGLALTVLGQWAVAGFTWVVNGIGGWFGMGNLAHPVAVGMLILLVIAFGVDLIFDRTANPVAMGAAVVLPMLCFLMLGGIAGAKGGQAVQASAQTAANLIMKIGGSG